MKLTLDLGNAEKNFGAAVEAMGKLTGFDRKGIIKAEAGSVLKRCLGETKPPPSQGILTTAGRLRAIRALGLTGRGSGALVTVNVGKKGPYGRVFLVKRNGEGYRRTHDGNFHPLNQHYKDRDWQALKAAVNDTKKTVAKVVPEVKASAGLARQSWDLIALSLGIDLTGVPGGSVSSSAILKVRNARARGGKQIRNGASLVEENGMKYAVVLINRLPYGSKLGFARLLLVAIAGREKFMKTAIAKGFNGSLEQTAKLFPGWTVKTISTA